MNGKLRIVYAIFYKLCLYMGIAVISLYRGISAAGELVLWACKYVSTALNELFELIYESVSSKHGKKQDGFSVARSVAHIGASVSSATVATGRKFKENGFSAGFSYVLYSLKRFFIGLWKRLCPVLNFAAPVAAIVFCVVVINKNTDFTYAISVKVDGEQIGLIQSETVYNNAVNSLISRVENVTGELYRVDIEPEFELIKVSYLEKFDTAADIEKQIIMKSPELFKESTGLYVNGELLAVTDYGNEVSEILESLLAKKEAEYLEQIGDAVPENIEFGFVDKVELRDGVYAVTDKKTVKEINDIITSVVSDEVRYTVEYGDSPKSIAKKFEMTISDLYGMNPGLEGSTIYPGDEVVVGNEVAFLPIQMSCTLTYEEETDIPVKYIETDKYYKGVKAVKKEGEAGINRVTASVIYVDGIETGRIILETVVVKEAVTKEMYLGTNKGFTLPSLDRSYIIPVEGGYISSPYGYRIHPTKGTYSLHTGIDIPRPKGTDIHAAASGKVIFMGWSGGWGNLVKIDHGNGYVSWYAHCSAFAKGLKVGDRVDVGETIAHVGTTGNSTGNHLHFEIRYKNQAIDINKLFPLKRG